jgi:tetratricopeptide (TPR) repeat protein
MPNLIATEARPSWKLDPRQHLLVGVVFVVALAVRGVYLWGQSQTNPLFDHPIMDARVHHDWARQIASGEGWDERPYFRAPLYYYTLALLYKLFGGSVAVGRVAGCVLGAATCYLIARLGIVLGGFRAGLLAGIIAAAYWPFIYFDAEPLTVGLEVLLDVALLLLLTLAARHRALWLFLVCGVIWGLSAITRPNMLAFLPGILIWLWLALPREQRARAWLARAALVCAGAAACILPVTLRNRIVAGEWILIASQGGVNFYIGNNPHSNGYTAIVPGTRPDWWGGFEDTHRIAEQALGHKPTEGEVSSYWYGKAVEWIRTEPGAWLVHMFRKLRLFWSPAEIPNNQPTWFFARLGWVPVLFCWVGFPLIACLGLAGMVVVLRQWRTWFLPIAFLVIYMGTVVAFFCPARYRLPIVPVLMLSAAAGILQVVELARARRIGPIVAYASVLVAGVIFFYSYRSDWTEFRQGGAGEGHYILGNHFAQAHDDQPADYERAAEHYAEAVKLRTKDPTIRLRLVETLIKLGRLEETEQQFAELLSAWPRDATVRYAYGVFLEGTGRPDAAVEQFEVALELHPRNADVHHKLADTLLKLGRYEEAAAQAQAALTLLPNLTPARMTLAVSLMQSGQLEKAVEQFDEVLSQQPANRSALHYRGSTLAKLGRFEQAIASLQEALRLDPFHAQANNALAGALQDVGRDKEALQVLRQALSGAPREPRLVNRLAWLLATTTDDEVRDGERAVTLAQQAVELSGQPYPETLDTLAAAYAAAGRLEEAINTARQAIEIARRSGRDERAAEIETRLRLYEQGQSYRAPRANADAN